MALALLVAAPPARAGAPRAQTPEQAQTPVQAQTSEQAQTPEQDSVAAAERSALADLAECRESVADVAGAAAGAAERTPGEECDAMLTAVPQFVDASGMLG